MLLGSIRLCETNQKSFCEFVQVPEVTLMKQDSTAPVAAKAEQDPHWPWSLTDVTIPSSLQSMVQFMYDERCV